MPPKNHLHTYMRVGRARNGRQYRCIDSHCSHISYKDLLEGKAAACPECGREYNLDSYCFKLKLPKCPACSKEKRRKEIWEEKKKAEEIAKNVLGEVLT